MTTARPLTRLPAVRGTLEPQADLARTAWLRVGGRAQMLFRPADSDDLKAFLAGRPAEVPLTTIGVASNLLIRDGGIDGIVVRLTGPLARIETDGTSITAGGGALDGNVAAAARRAGISGLEFFIGIPGTVGGAVRMNAGAFGSETAEILNNVACVDGSGRTHELTAADLGFSYRHSNLPTDWIVLSATFCGTPDDSEAIGERMRRIKAERDASQPIRVATGGSTFKNPPGDKAWRLIDQAGCRGLERGAAKVSDKHCNFLVNTGGATAADIEALGEDVRARVAQHSGVVLEWEIERIGRRLQSLEGAA